MHCMPCHLLLVVVGHRVPVSKTRRAAEAAEVVGRPVSAADAAMEPEALAPWLQFRTPPARTPEALHIEDMWLGVSPCMNANLWPSFLSCLSVVLSMLYADFPRLLARPLRFPHLNDEPCYSSRPCLRNFLSCCWHVL